jgi:polo-like kinase 1
MPDDRYKDLKEVPEIVIDPQSNKRYLRGKFLGKGGFARCYELTNLETRTIYAGKIVAKSMLTKKHQKDKMAQEIAIHRTLENKFVVQFHSFFEDNENVYVLLELCRRRSLMELHKRRRAITEPEARYFTHQIVVACVYLHDKRVIHRDLKLGNLFINEEMEVKIGDFGLATTLDYDGERKKTLCGTPNYIAPEMLGKRGHSYEVDIWAIGCILYTLLIGKPPFETQSLKETYMRIKKNEYHIPSRVGAPARNLMQRLLAADPTQRPTIHEVLDFEFFTQGYMPSRLPTSCLTMAPKFPSQSQLPSIANRQNLADPSQAACMSPKDQVRKDMMAAPLRPLNSVPENQAMDVEPSGGQGPQQCQLETPRVGDMLMPDDFYLGDLFRQLTTLISSKPSDKAHIREDDAEDPACVPVFWVSKWVDYSDKYGLGYQLGDNSVGVLFNDGTKIVLDGAGEQVQYIERDNRESYYTIHACPAPLNKKFTLLKYFANYMKEHLVKAGENMCARDGDELARLPCLRTWFRTRSAIVLHLTNGTLQVNFFQCHSKMILCPLMGAVTFINEGKEFRTYKLSALEKYGCGKELFARLRYCRSMCERILTNPSASRPNALNSGASGQSTGGSAMTTMRSAMSVNQLNVPAGGAAASLLTRQTSVGVAGAR